MQVKKEAMANIVQQLEKQQRDLQFQLHLGRRVINDQARKNAVAKRELAALQELIFVAKGGKKTK